MLAITEKQGTKFLKSKNINSVSIGIYYQGETVTNHLGELYKGEGNTPNDQTIYEIGSVTKTLTGYLMAKAVLDGKINLEDDIRKYLNGDYPNLAYESEAITIRHLLTHTAGLPLFLPEPANVIFQKLQKDVPQEYYKIEKEYTKDQFFTDLRKLEITAKPGTKYSYSNSGVELVGYILESIYEKDLDTLLEEHILNRYGMTDTAIKLDESKKERLAQGYWLDNKTLSPNQLNTLWAAGSGLKMTMADMMRYAKAQLDDSDPVIVKSHEPLFAQNSASKMGYLWQMRLDKHGKYFNHHGGTTGMQNWLFIFPKYDLVISIITNQSGPKTPKLLSKTANQILKGVIK
ncbi:hypothetical protein BFP71_09680 [Roseivirga misakiensis]|uniref:Beta-lactamase-related domain-containing protein n=1 Tax=Roseivirga misakiensis TaxID=1563681 RepID=A0A1E5T2C2_9BACT|nr:hypothetical protein BFP71_09680 [Roseivirga misakiensis]